MTLENITPEALDQIEKELAKALGDVRMIRAFAGSGKVSIRDTASDINRIGADIEKAIYPEDQEP